MNRVELVEKSHPTLSVRAQCELLGVSRSLLNYQPVEESEEDTRIMRLLDKIYMSDPCVGSRRLVTVLERPNCYGHIKLNPQPRKSTGGAHHKLI